MENEYGNVETDSIVDLEVHVRDLVDPTDPIAELHAAALDKEVDPILAGSVEAMAVGPWADVDVHQAAAPDVGYIAEGFEPRWNTTVIQPSVAFEAMAHHHGAEQSVSYPVWVTYFGPHPSASRTMFGRAQSCPRSVFAV